MLTIVLNNSKGVNVAWSMPSCNFFVNNLFFSMLSLDTIQTKRSYLHINRDLLTSQTVLIQFKMLIVVDFI